MQQSFCTIFVNNNFVGAHKKKTEKEYKINIVEIYLPIAKVHNEKWECNLKKQQDWYV